MAGLAAYAAVRLRGRTRVRVAAAFVTAGGAFVLCWGPFLWEQRHLFATDDPSTLFLRDAMPGHARRVLAAALAVPGLMLAAVGAGGWCLAPLYVIPLMLARRQPRLLLWAAVLLGTVGLLAGLDLTRQTLHVAYGRYLILAGPPTFVLIPAIAGRLRSRWLGRLVPTAAVAVCVGLIGQAYRSTTADPRQIAARLGAVAGPADLVVVLGTRPNQWTANATYLILTRCLRPIPSPVAIEHDRPGPAVLRRAGRSRRVFAFDPDGDPAALFPGLTTVGTIDAGGGPVAWVLRPAARPDGR